LASQFASHFASAHRTTAGNSCILLGAVLSLLLISQPAYAAIYKWVDAAGRTHYSEKQADAGQAKVIELRVAPPPASAPSSHSFTQDWQDREKQFQQRQLEKEKGRTAKPDRKATPKSPPLAGSTDDSDATKCNLARDVLSGAVRHGNGAPTDAYDRQVAEGDVANFCH